MILIDSDRVSFESLGVTEKALELGLLKPLENVPTKNAGDYKGVEVDVDCKENQEALVDVCDYGIKSVAYYREQAEGNPTYGKNIKGAPDVNFVREGVAKKLSKINEILDQLLDIREKCDDENNVEVKEIEDNKVDLSKMISKNSLIEIYYLNNEKQVESIANERKIPVSNLYKQNSDFNETKRIIIYEY